MDSPPRPSTPPPAPATAILRNEAALFSLKRPQLTALCKEHGLKRSGKNVDLIQRLQEHGAVLTAQQERGVEDSMCLADTSNASWAVLKEDVAPAQEDLAEFGVTGASRPSTSSPSIKLIRKTHRTCRKRERQLEVEGEYAQVCLERIYRLDDPLSGS
ncbi:hypothetical protein JCM10213_001573 [Rhodosporidiobolus nylandii]